MEVEQQHIVLVLSIFKMFSCKTSDARLNFFGNPNGKITESFKISRNSAQSLCVLRNSSAFVRVDCHYTHILSFIYICFFFLRSLVSLHDCSSGPFRAYVVEVSL